MTPIVLLPDSTRFVFGAKLIVCDAEGTVIVPVKLRPAVAVMRPLNKFAAVPVE